jgi:hypothetical protein
MFRETLRLVPILLVLAFLGWSQTASAHPGHIHEAETQSAREHRGSSVAV